MLAWVASLMCCVWCAIVCEKMCVSSGCLSGFKSTHPYPCHISWSHYSATVSCSSHPTPLLILSLSLSDKRHVLWGQLVLVFCTLLADLNALTCMAVTLQSHAGFDSAPGLQPVSHHPLPVYLLKLTESTGGTHTRTHSYILKHTHTYSCKGPLIFSFLVPAWAKNQSIHPSLSVGSKMWSRLQWTELECDRHAGVGSDCVLLASG